jgi:hypothetical protein
MAHGHRQIVKSSGGTSSTKTPSDMEELVKARALKRAERVEARGIEAEKRKETVRLHVPLTPCAWHRPSAHRRDARRTHHLT